MCAPTRRIPVVSGAFSPKTKAIIEDWFRVTKYLPGLSVHESASASVVNPASRNVSAMLRVAWKGVGDSFRKLMSPVLKLLVSIVY